MTARPAASTFRKARSSVRRRTAGSCDAAARAAGEYFVCCSYLSCARGNENGQRLRPHAYAQFARQHHRLAVEMRRTVRSAFDLDVFPASCDDAARAGEGAVEEARSEEGGRRPP